MLNLQQISECGFAFSHIQEFNAQKNHCSKSSSKGAKSKSIDGLNISELVKLIRKAEETTETQVCSFFMYQTWYYYCYLRCPYVTRPHFKSMNAPPLAKIRKAIKIITNNFSQTCADMAYDCPIKQGLCGNARQVAKFNKKKLSKIIGNQLRFTNIKFMILYWLTILMCFVTYHFEYQIKHYLQIFQTDAENVHAYVQSVHDIFDDDIIFN